MDVRTEVTVKGVLALLALAAVVWRHTRAKRLKAEQAGAVLGLMAVVAVAAYVNFGAFHGRAIIHHWEQFHYFLGSKYFPEVGYDGLYFASLAAQRESHPELAVQPYVRDLRTNRVVPEPSVRHMEDAVKERFTPERWRRFVADNGYFLSSNRLDYIRQIRLDHGYNPTPAWTFAGRLFSAWLPASDRTLTALVLIDWALLAGMFVLVFRTYGGRVGCLVLIVFGLGYPWRWDWVGGAFLRQDWLAAVGAGVCLLKRDRAGLAGALFGWAAMVRIFPALLLFGPGVVAVRELSRRRFPRWAPRLGLGVVAAVAIGLLAGSLTGRGVEAWPEFAHNLEKHHETWLTNNVGLENLLLYDRATVTRADVDFSLPEPWIVWQRKMTRRQEERRLPILAASLLIIAVIGAAVWRMDSDEAAIASIGVVFAAIVLTCYYWVMLCLIPLGRGRWGPTAGVLAISAGGFFLHLATPSFELIYGLISVALTVFFVSWLLPEAVRAVRGSSTGA